jgi:diaminopimelate decarboxylase
MKANPSLAVLQTFAALGCGFDIVSGGELLRVLAAGGEASKVVFSGVGKTAAEMELALHHGVHCFNVESEAELELLSAVATRCGRTAAVSLRVNPDVDAGTHPYISTGLKNNKFGIAHERAVQVYQRAASLPGLEVIGIDCHIGSQITQIEPYLDAMDRLLDLVESVEAHGIPIQHVDIGGGLGITYTDETPPDPAFLIHRVRQRLHERGHAERCLLLEPGRSLVGNAGVLVTRVLYLKSAEAKNFCIVDAAMNDLLRPALYEAYMGIEPCRHRGSELAQAWDVVGPVCESGDWLGRDRVLAIQAQDYLAVLSAGAYGMAMASNYNSRARPAEVMVRDGRASLIRRRDDLAQLFAGEHLL